MLPLILALLLVVVLFGAGAAWHLLWWVAIIAMVVWLVGFIAHPSGRSGPWY